MSTQQRGEDTHRRILDAAAGCFAKRGYDATGVAEICQAARVTKGAFYHHFPSKQALFLELLERWLAGLDRQLQVASAGTRTIPDALRSMVERAGTVLQEAGGQLPMFLEFWDQASHDPAVWQATIAPYRRYHAFLRGLVEQGIAEGSFRPVQPDMAAQLILSLAVGLLLQGLLDPEGADWAQVARDCLQTLLEGLQRKG